MRNLHSRFHISKMKTGMGQKKSETHQNIKITNYARKVDSLTRNAIQYVELIDNCLHIGFKDSTGLMLSASLFVN